MYYSGKTILYGCGGAGVVNSPDLDGSYGDNPKGIFFYTDKDEYKEWTGDYHYSDTPMNMAQPPELVVNQK